MVRRVFRRSSPKVTNSGHKGLEIEMVVRVERRRLASIDFKCEIIQ